MPQIDAQEVQHYLELLFPDPPPDAWLVPSWLAGPDDFRSQWFRVTQIDEATRFIVQQAQQRDVYVGLGLRHPQCIPQGRGRSEDVYAIGGLWFEADHNGGVHSAQNLPTPGQLDLFIGGLPFRCSLLIDSTGGNHGYLLFKELWILDTPEEHQKAALLLRRFQRTIQAQAATHGWKVDSTADLTRVLRPTGTLNYKSGTPKPVTILYEDGIRYNPSDIADAPWLATIEDNYVPSTGTGDFPPTRLEPIIDGCAWLRHCRDDAATLPEPEWYGMLGIVGRCEDGEQFAHEWSAPYPRYSPNETAKKLKHAFMAAGPLTCGTIRYDKGGDAHCRACPHWGKIKSPIVLGMPPQPKIILSHSSQNGHVGTHAQHALDAAEAAKQAADALLQTLSTCADDAQEDAVLDALPGVVALDAVSWMRLKRQLKAAVPRLNLNDVERARTELRQKNTSGATPGVGTAQGQLAAALAAAHAGRLAYDLQQQEWMAYDSGRWSPVPPELVRQIIITFMDNCMAGNYSWNDAAGVGKLLENG